ncbi:MAG: D-alanine--D-alanine ligase [Candidatus Paceibacterota bacterium]|jgi:D-alanine-D-alanine ligase
MSFAHKIRVGVLRGGPSPEYDVSLNTGKTILANLPDEYIPLDIWVSKNGIWHTSGLEKNPYDILKMVDVVVNAMHGFYGEDGTVQRFLENFGVPYTGSGSLASALGMNKIMSKNIFNKNGLKTPHHIFIEKSEDEDIDKKMINTIYQSMPFPIIIKPVSSGSSFGISFVDKLGDLKEALKNSFKHSNKLLIEEYINGKEATCGVVEGFRGQNFYTLLPIEIDQNKGDVFYDFDSKYKNLESRCKIPGNFSEHEKRQITEATILAHQILGLRHYSRADFIFHPKRGLFILEVNTLPELTHRSPFIKSLEAVGGDIREFLSHLISTALSK